MMRLLFEHVGAYTSEREDVYMIDETKLFQHVSLHFLKIGFYKI